MKKQYKKPEMKEVKLKQRSSLLSNSIPGELNYNAAEEMTRKDA